MNQGAAGPIAALDDPADVVGRAGQVAEHDRRRPPVRDEREHHAADDDHLDRSPQADADAAAGRRRKKRSQT